MEEAIYTPYHGGYEPPLPPEDEHEAIVYVLTSRNEKLYLLRVTSERLSRQIVPEGEEVPILKRTWDWYRCLPFGRTIKEKDMHVPLLKYEYGMQFYQQRENMTLAYVEERSPEYSTVETLSPRGDLLIAYQERMRRPSGGYEITRQVLTPKQQADLEAYKQIEERTDHDHQNRTL